MRGGAGLILFPLPRQADTLSNTPTTVREAERTAGFHTAKGALCSHCVDQNGSCVDTQSQRGQEVPTSCVHRPQEATKLHESTRKNSVNGSLSIFTDFSTRPMFDIPYAQEHTCLPKPFQLAIAF